MVKRTGTCFSLIVSSTLTLPAIMMIIYLTHAIMHKKYCLNKNWKTGEKDVRLNLYDQYWK